MLLLNCPDTFGLLLSYPVVFVVLSHIVLTSFCVGARSIAISMSFCLFLCLSVSLCVCQHVSKTHIQTSRIFVQWFGPGSVLFWQQSNILYTSGVVFTLWCMYSGLAAVVNDERPVTPTWMISTCLHLAANNFIRRCGGRVGLLLGGGKVWRLLLPCLCVIRAEIK